MVTILRSPYLTPPHHYRTAALPHHRAAHHYQPCASQIATLYPLVLVAIVLMTQCCQVAYIRWKGKEGYFLRGALVTLVLEILNITLPTTSTIIFSSWSCGKRDI